jgi:hypothetical protein
MPTIAHVLAAISGTPTSPPPPPAGFTNIAQMTVSNAPPGGGNVELGVPLSQAQNITAIGSVRVDGVTAQADNVHKDRDGYVRWFMLSAGPIANGSGKVISVSPTAETASPVPFNDAIALSIVTGADSLGESTAATFTSTAAVAAGQLCWWRRGPIVSEGVFRHTIGGNVLSPEFLIAKWANGNSKSSFAMDNGLFTPRSSYNATDSVAPATVRYTANCTRGAENKNYSTPFLHPPAARWLRYFGDTEAHASLQPLGWGGTAIAGHATYWRASGMWQNYTGTFSAITAQQLASIGTTQPGSPSVGDTYTPDQPINKSLRWNGSIWEAQWPYGTYGSLTSIGQYTCEQGQPGDNPDIGLQTAYNLQAFDNYDANGKTYLCAHADRRVELCHNIRLASTGNFPRFDDGYDYVIDSRWVSASSPGVFAREGSTFNDAACNNSTTLTSASADFTNHAGRIIYIYGTGFTEGAYQIASVTNAHTVVLTRQPSTTNATGGQIQLNLGYASANQYTEEAHFGAMFYPPYMATGRYWYFKGMVASELWNMLITPYGEGAIEHNAKGNGMNRNAMYVGWTDDFWDTKPGYLGFRQGRGCGWAWRNTVQTLACMPDDDTKALATTGWDRAMLRTVSSNTQTSLKTCMIDVGTNTTGRFVTPGARRFQENGGVTLGVNGGSTAWWAYIPGVAMGHAKELGELTADGFAWAKWYWSGYALLFAQTAYPVIKELLHAPNLPWNATNDFRYWGNYTTITPFRQWDEIYDALRGYDPTSYPVKTTPNYWSTNIGPGGSDDYLGGRHENVVYAKQYGDANADAALTWLVATAQHYYSQNYFYSLRHYLTPR